MSCCGGVQQPRQQRIRQESNNNTQLQANVIPPVMPPTSPIMERHRQIHEDLARTRYHQNRFGR